ncbi:uncharacterized protein BDW70DRAFT_145916 [Aspergillus foveolatus]|uniref:uncharacterized protein n=1 Tax=Aspergillus foveolatus TaxID=210207 RepID=UPI003CCD951B
MNFEHWLPKIIPLGKCKVLTVICGWGEAHVGESSRCSDSDPNHSNMCVCEAPELVDPLQYPYPGDAVNLAVLSGSAVPHGVDPETRLSLEREQAPEQPGPHFHHGTFVESLESKAVSTPKPSEGVKKRGRQGAMADPTLRNSCPGKQHPLPHESILVLPTPEEPKHFLDLSYETYQDIVDESSGILDTVSAVEQESTRFLVGSTADDLALPSISSQPTSQRANVPQDRLMGFESTGLAASSGQHDTESEIGSDPEARDNIRESGVLGHGFNPLLHYDGWMDDAGPPPPSTSQRTDGELRPI